ncbi:MAG: hypothetical protein BWZ03_00089 [bacterium ADurb.BinA186]|nr:MAG: hypothetical protein BWZ03_00089 [bacterium ADurb.BinA186]
MNETELKASLDQVQGAISQVEELLKVVSESQANAKMAAARLSQLLTASTQGGSIRGVIVAQRKAEVIAQVERFSTVANSALSMAPQLSQGLDALVAAFTAAGEEA